MEDFNGENIEIGDTIFFAHKIGQVIIGQISEIKGKKTIIVKIEDIIKHSPKFMAYGYGIVVNSDRVIKLK